LTFIEHVEASAVAHCPMLGYGTGIGDGADGVKQTFGNAIVIPPMFVDTCTKASRISA
jgi:hypothetical protein